jgi:predicted MPP superfamily phosphohydrolase
MRMNRRRFLALGSLSGVGLAFLGKVTIGQDKKPIAPTLKTPAVAASDPILRLVAIADVGSGDRNQYDVGRAMSRYRQSHPYNLALLGGDNIYTNGEMEKIANVFEHPYAESIEQGVEFRACLGNHDIRSQNGDLQVKYASFNMTGRYYTYRKESVQFFVLDTNTNADWKAQMAWLEKSLRQSNAPWKIVYGHHPIYSSGLYGTNTEMVARLTPLFKKYRVQLYINGHEHHYERTTPINGTTYLVTGIGGASLRPVEKSKWTAHAESRFGFSALAVYNDRLEIQGIGTDGQSFDRGIVEL